MSGKVVKSNFFILELTDQLDKNALFFFNLREF